MPASGIHSRPKLAEKARYNSLRKISKQQQKEKCCTIDEFSSFVHVRRQRASHSFNVNGSSFIRNWFIRKQ